MNHNNIINNITETINKAETLSPCLFLGENIELLNANVFQIAQELLDNFNIPHTYIYTLGDNGEKIKIAEIKSFTQPSNSLPGFPFQIFIIENISRLTLQSANSCLKFFEEPGKHNIIFLTNQSESGILDTILSRVQIIKIGGKKQETENPFFQSLIQEISKNNKKQSLNYFYNSKLEKEEYIHFLENIILFAKKHFCFIDSLEQIESDIQNIKQNNVNPRYVIDKYILTL
ncbi:MAG: hypothetical protein GY828_06555 [Candidatus Gracilibacteria bacterium]|nr:hypothetical protein [Candidatus Gracilibacteria bacterium]